jgi:hypothetical protein
MAKYMGKVKRAINSEKMARHKVIGNGPANSKPNMVP